MGISLSEEVSSIAGLLSSLETAVSNTTGIDVLTSRQTELNDLINHIRHPDRQIIYGRWVVGDDSETQADCPDGLVVMNTDRPSIGCMILN